MERIFSRRAAEPQRRSPPGFANMQSVVVSLVVLAFTWTDANLQSAAWCYKVVTAIRNDDTVSPHSNRMKRLVKTPKLNIGDTGLACSLLGVDAETLWDGTDILKNIKH